MKQHLYEDMKYIIIFKNGIIILSEGKKKKRIEDMGSEDINFFFF